MAEGQGGRSRINLEESCGPIRWTPSGELGTRWGRRGDRAAREVGLERGFSRCGQEHPPPRHRGGAEGFGDTRTLSLWKYQE